MKKLKQFFLMIMYLLNTYSSYAQAKHINQYPSAELKKKHKANLSLHDFKEARYDESNLFIHMPLAEARVTSSFGWRKHPVTGKTDFHQGVDLVAKDKIVRNIMNGTVIRTGYHKNLGNYVLVDHGIFQSLYGHLSAVTVYVNQIIAARCPVGIIGSTGRVTGEHLHFAIKFKGLYINPLKFLQNLNYQEY